MNILDAAAENSSLIKPNILLIEDEFSLQALHSIYLEKAGYTFQLAPNGKEAIRIFNENHFDLILLDIELPDISGIEVNKRIRSSYYGRNIPIIALTSLGKSIEKECLNAGVDQVLDKPIKYNQFVKSVQTALSL